MEQRRPGEERIVAVDAVVGGEDGQARKDRPLADQCAFRQPRRNYGNYGDSALNHCEPWLSDESRCAPAVVSTAFAMMKLCC